MTREDTTKTAYYIEDIIINLMMTVRVLGNLKYIMYIALLLLF